MILIHPMEEDGARFLSCCYGYCTTIRRAQGADIFHGCLYMDNKWHAAARGYGYVGVSRFRSRQGVYLYGKLRRSDFLPVGPELESEAVKRGYLSVDSSDDEGAGLEYAFAGQEEESSEEDYGTTPCGNVINAVDFVPL